MKVIEISNEKILKYLMKAIEISNEGCWKYQVNVK